MSLICSCMSLSIPCSNITLILGQTWPNVIESVHRSYIDIDISFMYWRIAKQTLWAVQNFYSQSIWNYIDRNRNCLDFTLMVRMYHMCNILHTIRLLLMISRKKNLYTYFLLFLISTKLRTLRDYVVTLYSVIRTSERKGRQSYRNKFKVDIEFLLSSSLNNMH